MKLVENFDKKSILIPKIAEIPFSAIPGRKLIMIKKFFIKYFRKIFFCYFWPGIDNDNWPEKVFSETRCIVRIAHRGRLRLSKGSSSSSSASSDARLSMRIIINLFPDPSRAFSSGTFERGPDLNRNLDESMGLREAPPVSEGASSSSEKSLCSRSLIFDRSRSMVLVVVLELASRMGFDYLKML